MIYPCLVLLALHAIGEKDRVPGCGRQSLYILSRLEGRPVPRDATSTLLKFGEESISMADLRAEAATLGLSLVGVKLPSGPVAPDRPAIVFMDRRPHGHFLVIRPVGTTGRLVQVLDPNREPEVVDARSLYASSEWTGLALVPERRSWRARIAIAAGVLAALLGSVVLITRKSRPVVVFDETTSGRESTSS